LEKIKDWVKKVGGEYVEYQDDSTDYIVCPQYIFFKYKNAETYFLSFDISLDCQTAIMLFISIQGDFIEDKIEFIIYEDCIMSVDGGKLEYFCFNPDAENYYFEYIAENIKNLTKNSKNVTFH